MFVTQFSYILKALKPFLTVSELLTLNLILYKVTFDFYQWFSSEKCLSVQRWLFGGISGIISPSHENKSPSLKNPHPRKIPWIKIPKKSPGMEI